MSRTTFIVFGLFAFLYLLFPNNNYVPDSIEYASNIKYYEHLFRSHHLLYNALGVVIVYTLKSIVPAVDTLKTMQFVNGVAALACLILLFRIILLQYKNEAKALLWIFFAGSCFAVLRFGAENETYIIPIFFSLLSSLYFLKFNQKRKWTFILLSSLFGVIGFLFHQIHIFWWIGILLGLLFYKHYKALLLYASIGVLMPLTYIMVLIFYNNSELTTDNLKNFVLQSYYSGGADIKIGLHNFLLTPISFIRTFFQVHGNIVDLLKQLPELGLSLIITIVLIILALRQKKIVTRIQKSNQHIFMTTHFAIFVLQLAFAFFSHGNAEFMVMLPFLLALFLPIYCNVNYKFLVYISCAMLVWNVSFALFPNHFLDYQNNGRLVEIIDENPNAQFIFKEHNIVVGNYYYVHGQLPQNMYMGNISELRDKHKLTVLTDVLTKKIPFSRASVVQKPINQQLKFVRHIDSVNCFLGKYYIDEVVVLD